MHCVRFVRFVISQENGAGWIMGTNPPPDASFGYYYSKVMFHTVGQMMMVHPPTHTVCVHYPRLHLPSVHC